MFCVARSRWKNKYLCFVLGYGILLPPPPGGHIPTNHFHEFQKEMGDKLIAEHVTPWLERYEKFLTENGTGYFVGDDVSHFRLFMVNAWRRGIFIFNSTFAKRIFSYY
jgi:hypothetical protein